MCEGRTAWFYTAGQEDPKWKSGVLDSNLDLDLIMAWSSHRATTHLNHKLGLILALCYALSVNPSAVWLAFSASLPDLLWGFFIIFDISDKVYQMSSKSS